MKQPLKDSSRKIIITLITIFNIGILCATIILMNQDDGNQNPTKDEIITMVQPTEAISADQNLVIKEILPTKEALQPTEELQQPNDSEDREPSSFKATRDGGYKMFYGEWEVTKIVGVDIRYPNYPIDMERAESLIGRRVSYTYQSFKLEDVEMLKDPIYTIEILPVEKNKSYIGGMPTLEEIGITGNYFAFISIHNVNDLLGDMDGTEFYVKDDNTLILFERDVYYELKRISYIENGERWHQHL
ncbi:MAG: hypothetical protein ACYDEX_21750 [Mobilitalea sp.]